MAESQSKEMGGESAWINFSEKDYVCLQPFWTHKAVKEDQIFQFYFIKERVPNAVSHNVFLMFTVIRSSEFEAFRVMQFLYINQL